jgi:hypothetical protein
VPGGGRRISSQRNPKSFLRPHSRAFSRHLASRRAIVPQDLARDTFRDLIDPGERRVDLPGRARAADRDRGSARRQKIIFVSIAFDGRQSPLGRRLAPSIPRMDKTGEPDPPRALARVFASSSSGAHTRDRVVRQRLHHVRFGSTSRCTVPVASRSPRPVARARASSASSTPSVRSGFTIGAFFFASRACIVLSLYVHYHPPNRTRPLATLRSRSKSRASARVVPSPRPDGWILDASGASRPRRRRRVRGRRVRVIDTRGGASERERAVRASSSRRRSIDRSTWRRSTSSRFARSRARARRWNFERNG